MIVLDNSQSLLMFTYEIKLYQIKLSWGARKIAGKNHRYSNANQPPTKNNTKCNEAINR